MNYKKWLIEDLQDLGRLRFACGQLRRELDTIDAEIAAIECGPETAERKEWLLDARARWVDVDVNLKATEMHVADMEALLAGLPDEERTVVMAMFVDAVPGAVGVLMERLHVESAQVYRIKDRAMNHLAQMRYGCGWKR